MKYLAIASFAAVAAATPALQARDGWETAPKPVDPATTSTWNEWETIKTPKPTSTSTWYEWDGKGPKPPKPTDTEVDWEEWTKHPVYTTTVVTAITTYCPEPTTIVHAGKTWTVTSATTLTITECPCTISVPVWTKTSTSCKEKPTPVDDKSTWAGYPAPSKPVDDKSTWAGYPAPSSKTPVDDKSTWAEYPAPSSTKPAASSTWAQWSETKKAPVATWTGAANKLNAGAGLAGILGAAALLL